ncbi:MAG TPA: 6,7-dimethyl-8-ribityllumazine synthase [Candidatus Angelobacter sp.]
MIKTITTVRATKNAKEFDALVALFKTLGLKAGKEWKSAKGRGAPFHGPVGTLEFVEGEQSLGADIWIEVTDLDTIRDLLRKQKIKFAADIEETGWNSRVLVIKPSKGMHFAFWQHNQPRADAVEGELNSAGMRLAIVVSRWNSFITERLLQGALDALRRTGCHEKDITVVRVPGSFEVPSQARTLAETGKFDGIIPLGCLIRGETDHYEHIATEVTRGIGQSAQETGVPHTYGVLTCENLEQALDRAGLKSGNKGFEAALSAVEMISLKRKTGRASRGKSKGKAE